MKSAKRKGTRNEHRSKVLLEAAGYAVTRAAGSLGDWDLVAVSATDFALIQGKSNRTPGTGRTGGAGAFPLPANCKRLIHIWVDRQRLPRVMEL